MIGITLVTLVTMLAVSIRASFFGAVDKIWIADYAVTAENNFDLIPIAIGNQLRKTPGVHNVVGVRWGEARAFGGKHSLSGIDPGASHIFQMDWTEGSQRTFDTLGAERRVHRQGLCEGPRPDPRLEVPDPHPGRRAAAVHDQGDLRPAGGGLAVRRDHDREPRSTTSSTRRRRTSSSSSTSTAASRRPTARSSTRRSQASRTRRSRTGDEFKDNQASFLKNILNILYVLLALSVIVSLFGIVNTLVLTIFERTRELGMLRAVGMTRWQVRTMIALESVVTALIGAVIGIALGIVLAVLLIVRVDFLVLSWPVTSLFVFALVAIIAGIVAAIFPAQRAARLNVLEALQYE